MARPICSCSSTRTRPGAHVKVTEHRAACDFAHGMRDLTDIHYPNAELILGGDGKSLNA